MKHYKLHKKNNEQILKFYISDNAIASNHQYKENPKI